MNNSTENEDDYRYAGFGGLNFNEDVEIELPDIANTAVLETDDDEEIEIANQAIVEQYNEKLFKEELERKEMALILTYLGLWRSNRVSYSAPSTSLQIWDIPIVLFDMPQKLLWCWLGYCRGSSAGVRKNQSSY